MIISNYCLEQSGCIFAVTFACDNAIQSLPLVRPLSLSYRFFFRFITKIGVNVLMVEENYMILKSITIKTVLYLSLLTGSLLYEYVS